MKYPYVISSDQHCHAWSSFSTVGPDGVNSRLRTILNEIRRSADVLVARGGDRMFLAGDLFHQRGEIKPSVFNPTVETFKTIQDEYPDLAIHAIPGNHDLEGKEASSLGNAMQALGTIDRFSVDTSIELHGDVIVIPWYQDLNELRKHLASQAAGMRGAGLLEKTDVIIHAPVNDVIKGIPNHGLEASELAAYGFRRVFAGHYHDHKVMEGGKVISVGATGHQTWSDPGTKAGFLLVWEDRIEHVESLCPKFVDLDLTTASDPFELEAEGNYVRLRLEEVSEKEIKSWRDDLTKAGALGVMIIATKKQVNGRSGTAAAKSAVSLDASVHAFIDNDMKPLLHAEVSALAQECLDEARS